MSAQTAPPPPRPRPLTTAEFKALPRTAARQELHEGVLVELPPPPKRHTRLANRMRDVLPANACPGWEALTGLGCEPVPGSRNPESGLRDTVAEPDVAYVTTAALEATPPEDYLAGSPPLVVEVRSPSDALGEITWKAGRSLPAGAALVWVLDPKRRRAMVFSAGRGLAELLPEDGELAGEDVLPGVRLPLAALWEGPDGPGDRDGPA
jgi:Uma2 family endonuclease